MGHAAAIGIGAGVAQPAVRLINTSKITPRLLKVGIRLLLSLFIRGILGFCLFSLLLAKRLGLCHERIETPLDGYDFCFGCV